MRQLEERKTLTFQENDFAEHIKKKGLKIWMIDFFFILEGHKQSGRTWISAFSMSCYVNVSDFFTLRETHNHVLEAWAQNKLFGCLIC